MESSTNVTSMFTRAKREHRSATKRHGIMKTTATDVKRTFLPSRKMDWATRFVTSLGTHGGFLHQSKFECLLDALQEVERRLQPRQEETPFQRYIEFLNEESNKSEKQKCEMNKN